MMSSEQKSAYGKTIKRKGADAATARLPSEEETKIERMEATIARRSQLISTPDKLAGHKLFFRNWMTPEGKNMHPQHPDLWYVDRYYPMAEGGPIAFDHPETPSEMERAKKKIPSMKASKVRFYIIDRKKTLEEMLQEVAVLAVPS